MEPLDNKTKQVLDAVAILIVVSLVVVFLGLIGLVWHYLLCAWCLTGCIFCLVRGNRRTAAAAAVLNVVIAVVGFFMVYESLFKTSGETFTDYVTKYGIFTLPIFLLPCVSLMLVGRVNAKKNDTLKGKHHGKL